MRDQDLVAEFRSIKGITSAALAVEQLIERELRVRIVSTFLDLGSHQFPRGTWDVLRESLRGRNE